MSDTFPVVNERHVNGGAEIIMSLEELIKNHIDGIDKMAGEIRQKREMLKDSFTNNPTYREHDDRVKEASKAKSSVRQQIAKQPSVSKIAQEVKDLSFDLKERKKTLSDLLMDYKDQTGATQLELFSGQVVEIVQSAKIVRRSAKFNP